MNQKLANEALYRATEGLGEQAPGMCQRWARQCVQAVYGDRFDECWCSSALFTAQSFLAHPPSGVQVIRTSDPTQTQLGDLLYATHGHGGFGHVMIRVLGNRVAENSVVHHGPHGAIGFRDLFTPGLFDLVVRLPA